MKAFILKIFRWLSSRIALNIYFWLLALNLMYNNVQNQMDYPAKWYILFIGINISLLMLLVYFNNLYLVPRLLARKKRKLYFLCVFSFTFLIACIYTIVQKYIIIRFPKIEIMQISFISAPVTRKWSLSSLADEFQTYFVAFLMLVFIFTALWFMYDYSRQQKLNQLAAIKQTEAELNFLKSQLNPHFLFNTLNNLYGLALTKSDDAPLAILKLSSLMRYMLYESDVKLVSFEKEKEAIQAYIDLEMLRLDKDEIMNIKMEADHNYNIPPLLWLPVLENIYKHGTRLITDKFLLDFSFTIHNNVLKISSRNYFKPKTHAQNSGIGLDNLHKRLKLLFPGKYELTSGTEENIYSTTVTIQLA